MKELLAALAALAEIKDPSVYRILNAHFEKKAANAIADVMDAYKKVMESFPEDQEQDIVALTFGEHVKGCILLLAKKPEVADYKAVYCKTNDYGPHEEVVWLPTVGYLEGSGFVSEDSPTDFAKKQTSNAVCIN